MRRLPTRSWAASSRSTRAFMLFWSSSISMRTARARSTISGPAPSAATCSSVSVQIAPIRCNSFSEP